MALSSIVASFAAAIPTPGTRYQLGLPRRVGDSSMMSSSTSIVACSSSTSQPSTAASKNSAWDSTRPSRSSRTESMTLRPRLHFPPRVLWWSDWPDAVSVKATCETTEKHLLFQTVPTRAGATGTPPGTERAGRPPTEGRRTKSPAG
jgi:hypothetical protein